MTQKSMKFAAMLLASAMLAGTCACGSNDESSKTNSSGSSEESTSVAKAETCAYKSVALTSAGNSYYTGISGIDDMLYYAKTTYNDDSNEAKKAVYSCDFDGNETELFSCDNLLEGSDQTDIISFTAISGDTFAVVVSGGSNPDMAYEPDNEDFDWDSYYENYEQIYSLQVFEADGTLKWKTDLSDPGYGTIQADADGNLIGFFTKYDEETDEQSVLLQRFDSSGNVTEVSGLEDLYSIDATVRSADGSIYVMASAEDAWNQVMKWNPESQKFENLELDTDNLSVYGFVSSMNPDVPFYIYNDRAIYAVSPEDGKLTETLNFMDSNLTSSKFSGGVALASGEFIAMLNDSSYNTYLAKLSINENAGGAETLTLATYYLDDQLSEKVAAFNNAQDQYRIEVKTYDEYNNYEGEDESEWNKGMTVFHEDIAAGNIPDLVDVNSFNAQSYAEKGLFVDLYDYMEKDDTYTKDAFLPNFLAANEVDGALYWLAPTFSISGMMANDNLTGHKDSWTLQEYVDVCQSCVDQGIEIMEYQSQETFLRNIIYGSEFVDFFNGVCHFDDPGFVGLLELSKQVTSNEPDYDNMTDSEWEAYSMEQTMRYQNGEILLQNTNFWGFQDYATSKALFGDEPVTMIGCPKVSDKSSFQMSLNGAAIAITTSCEVPDVAWDFIRSTMEIDLETVYSFPVLTEDLDAYLAEDAKKMEQVVEGGYNYNGVDLKLQMPTDEELDAFKEVLYSVDRIQILDDALMSMVDETLQDFYDGNQTAEETANLLQQKCNLYLKENS